MEYADFEYCDSCGCHVDGAVGREDELFCRFCSPFLLTIKNGDGRTRPRMSKRWNDEHRETISILGSMFNILYNALQRP